MNWQATVAVTLVLFVFSGMTIPFLWWPIWDSATGVVSFAVYALLALAASLEMAESALGIFGRASAAPRISAPPARERTAVLMTVCGDWSPRFLRELRPLADAGYTVFVLDDSDQSEAMPADPGSGFSCIRRKDRSGAKAGNLNHWLKQFGDAYDNAILLDADSVMPPATADALVVAASRTEYAAVAVFQAKIDARGFCETYWGEILASVARPRMRVLDRVHGPLGLLLSLGHNQLLRLAAVRSLGGFDEQLTSEDTALSLALLSRGWGHLLVDAWSYDTEPRNAAVAVERGVRWARQTTELFQYPWRRVPLRVKLLLCRHVLSHVAPVLGVALLGFSLVTAPSNPLDVAVFMSASMTFQPGFHIFGLTLWTLYLLSALLLGLRYILGRREGIPAARQICALFVFGAYHAFLVIPLILGLVASAAGRAVRFRPTNRRRTKPASARLNASAGVLLMLLLWAAWSHPSGLLVGFNLFWFVTLQLAPLTERVFTAIRPDAPFRCVRGRIPEEVS